MINQGTNVYNTTVKLDFPYNFFADKNSITEILRDKEEKKFNFKAVSDISGMFSINLTVTYNGIVITKEILLNVYPPAEIEFIYIILLIIIIILVPFLILIYLRRRKRRYRTERLAEIKYLVRGTKPKRPTKSKKIFKEITKLERELKKGVSKKRQKQIENKISKLEKQVEEM